MKEPTGNDATSLAEQIVYRINRKQTDLARAVARRAGDAVTRALLDDISVLASEFQCAMYVERQLRLIQRRCADGAAGAPLP